MRVLVLCLKCNLPNIVPFFDMNMLPVYKRNRVELAITSAQ